MLDVLKEIFLGPSGILGIVLGAIAAAVNDYLARKRGDDALTQLGAAQAQAAGAEEIITLTKEEQDEKDALGRLSSDELRRRLQHYGIDADPKP